MLFVYCFIGDIVLLRQTFMYPLVKQVGNLAIYMTRTLYRPGVMAVSFRRPPKWWIGTAAFGTMSRWIYNLTFNWDTTLKLCMYRTSLAIDICVCNSYKTVILQCFNYFKPMIIFATSSSASNNLVSVWQFPLLQPFYCTGYPGTVRREFRTSSMHKLGNPLSFKTGC